LTCCHLLQGYGVIGSTEDGPEEIEHAPALSLALASLPGCSVSITHVTGPQLPDGGERVCRAGCVLLQGPTRALMRQQTYTHTRAPRRSQRPLPPCAARPCCMPRRTPDAPPDEWARLLGVPQLHSTHPTNFIVLAEPEFSQLQELTAGLDFAFPGANKIGACGVACACVLGAWLRVRPEQARGGCRVDRAGSGQARLHALVRLTRVCPPRAQHRRPRQRRQAEFGPGHVCMERRQAERRATSSSSAAAV
jgi:hypothetical protein